MLQGFDTITLILVIAVVVAVGLSAAALVVQIRRSRAGKQKVDKKSKANEAQGFSAAPRQDVNVRPQEIQPLWPLNAASGGRPDGDYDRTEALFTSGRESASPFGSAPTRPEIDSWMLQIVEKGPTGERSYSFKVSGEVSVGRSPTSGLHIDEKTVSGLQCVLIAGKDGVFVNNRSNSNITRLNGVRIEDTRPLKPGDTLDVGSVQLSLMDIRRGSAY